MATCLERKRAEKGWSYRDLADQLGVPLSMAYGWATGSTTPRLENIQLISKRLKLRMSDLVAL